MYKKVQFEHSKEIFKLCGWYTIPEMNREHFTMTKLMKLNRKGFLLQSEQSFEQSKIEENIRLSFSSAEQKIAALDTQYTLPSPSVDMSR